MVDENIDVLRKSRNRLRTWVIILSILLFINLVIIAITIFLQFLQTATNLDLLGKFFDLIAYVTNFVSLFLAIIAIWVSFHFQSTSDSVNSKTVDLLNDIKRHSESISSVVMPELKEYGNTSRQSLIRLVEMVSEMNRSRESNPTEAK